jgi:hypothetical protein
MNPSRATLAMTILSLLLLAACSEQAVVPTEPSRVAPMTSIPGSSSATVLTGHEAEQFAAATAAQWAAKGDFRLADYLTTRQKRVERPTPSRGRSASPRQPSLALIPDDPDSSPDESDPSPETRPSAEIYYSSTVPFVSGATGVIISSVTYYGNIATTEVAYSATAGNGIVMVPQTRVTNRGLGENAPCLGSWWECSWTFKFETVISVNLGKDCGITLKASGTHRAEWTIPGMKWFPGATWGTRFSSDIERASSSSPCAPTCLDPTASNYGGPLPCSYPPATSPTGGDGSTTPPSGGGTTDPYWYYPGPSAPLGHWVCVIYFMGTDYEEEYCTWYPDYTRLPKTSPSYALAGHAGASHIPSAATLPSVFVIVSDQVPADAMAVIERHKQGSFRNVLLVPSSTIRPATLVAALQALADSRDERGETPDKDLQLTLKGSILDQQIPAAARDYAASFASLIANARPADAGAYGVRPILEIRLGDRK